jgi:benzoyl-CoA-dihydrodiol lyase
MANQAALPPIGWETCPERYRHWQLAFDGPVATLSMNVDEEGGLVPGYRLKLNSYDLAVDIELADAIQRIRFEHPEVHAVVLTSLRERIFCAGANIFMLGQSSHGFKVNFCKFTNETRLAMEDASAHSGLKFLAALNGICAGGGYELALACDEILLVDDGNSAVSLPEIPLLGVLPGTGGLTRLVDKRKVRRDHADVVATLAEGVKGQRAVRWRLVDGLAPKSRFAAAVQERARRLAAQSDRPNGGPGVRLGPTSPVVSDREVRYSTVRLNLDREKRIAELVVSGPRSAQPSEPEGILAAGDQYWPLRAFRELDDALVRLRFSEPEIGTLLIKTEGAADAVLEIDRVLLTLILAVMALPTIISVSEDAMTAVGREIREASYGLGATRAETIINVVIPAGHSGILAAVILGMMRAIGETMVVWMASGNASRIPSPWWDLSQSIRTMTATIAGDMGETPKNSEHYFALFTVGLTLLLFTFSLNLLSEYLLGKARAGRGRR